MKASELEWGFKDEKIVSSALWGARCILDDRGKFPYLDILWDRQLVQGDTPELAKAFSDFLNVDGGPIDQLKLAVINDQLNRVEDEVEVLVLGGVQFHCRPAGGYAYVTARRVLSSEEGGQ